LAGFEVIPLLVIFLLPQDLLIVFVPVGCTIEVDNGYINDAVSTAREEVSEKEVTPLMRRSWGAGLVRGVACDSCCGVSRFGLGLGEDGGLELSEARGCGFLIESS
jgi:hypothetical protein